jgi:predicted nucleotidyltransferase component of viral defense system
MWKTNGLTFLPGTIRVERIRDEEAYEGVRVRVEARLGDARIPLQIDVGLGDTIVPASEELEYSTLLEFPAPKLHAYSKESVIAEKFEAMVKLGVANSRMKDFYDLWVLAQRFEFDSSTLAAAIQSTFKTRRTALPRSSPLALRTEFYELPTKQTQWRAFLQKNKLKADSSLKEIIEVIREFLMPVVDGVLTGNEEDQVWQPGGPWGKNRKT